MKGIVNVIALVAVSFLALLGIVMASFLRNEPILPYIFSLCLFFIAALWVSSKDGGEDKELEDYNKRYDRKIHLVSHSSIFREHSAVSNNINSEGQYYYSIVHPEITVSNRAFVAAGSKAEGKAISKWMFELGYDAICCDQESAFEMLRVSNVSGDVLIVDEKTYECITDLVDDLILFREECPSVIVILLLDRYVSDFMSSGRIVLCDLVLKTPLFRVPLFEYFEDAIYNNSVWRSRRNNI